MSASLSKEKTDSGFGGFTVIKNLTPHDILVVDGEKIIKIQKSGEVARISAKSKLVGGVQGISLYRTVFGTVENLPEPEVGTLYVVSALVRSALPDRMDLLSPSQLVRNSEGQVIGCAGFDIN